jgi:integrase
MPRQAKPLSAMKVRTAKPGRYCDGGGLYLLVRPNDTRFWLFRYRMPGGAKQREMGLGPVELSRVDRPDEPVELAPAGTNPARTLAEARVLAGELFRSVRMGRDPLTERRDAKKVEAPTARTFSDVAALYIEAHKAGWKNAKHAAQWSATLETYVFPVIGSLPVAAIDTGHVTAILEPLWRTKTETASRVRGRIESVLDFATARGWRVGDNPARWKGHLQNLLPAASKVARVVHHAALPWREVGAFMAQLKDQDGVAPWALAFTVLTAARTGEAVGASWSEIDLGEKLWRIPAERMKAAREHRVPLSTGAMDVLAEMAKLRTDRSDDAPVFPGGKPGRPLSNMALLMLLRRMERPDLTAHGFRSTFRDWCGEATNYPREVAEAALAHTIKDKAEAAYARSDLLEKRRRLMEDWAGFCARPAMAGEVVPIRGAG